MDSIGRVTSFYIIANENKINDANKNNIYIFYYNEHWHAPVSQENHAYFMNELNLLSDKNLTKLHISNYGMFFLAI